MRRIPAFVLALTALLVAAASLRSETAASTPARVPPTRPAARPAGPVQAEPLPNPPAESAEPALPVPPVDEKVDEPVTSKPAPIPPAQTAPEKKRTPVVVPSSPAPSRAPAQPDPSTTSPAPAVPVKSWLEAQIELARRGFSSGSIDAAVGPKTRAALRAFQDSQLLPTTGELDAATKARLVMTMPALGPRKLSVEELSGLQVLSPTWLGKSEQPALAHQTPLELAAEKYHAHPLLLKKLNPNVDWAAVTPDTELMVPAIDRVDLGGQRAARLEIRLAEFVLEARDAAGRIIAHFPVSIGRLAESRPAGELRVTVVIPDPNYTFDPAIFPESPEARELGRKLILQPGPNNPVGVAWIGLDRPGYGIHGTPAPERIGAAESHGCFRLANWDARTLVTLAWTGLPVDVIAESAN